MWIPPWIAWAPALGFLGAAGSEKNDAQVAVENTPGLPEHARLLRAAEFAEEYRPSNAIKRARYFRLPLADRDVGIIVGRRKNRLTVWRVL